MRRATLRTGLALCAAALLATDAGAPTVNLVNGIGLFDYTRKPDFKVGDWVRYRIQANSVLGSRDDYTVTLLIAGEETFWGEDAFWLETWTEPIDRPPQTVATLMSYAIFEDTLAFAHLELYMRKTINELMEDGTPLQLLSRRPPGTLKKRSPIDDQISWSVDTVGADTVMVPRGTFQCSKVLTRQGRVATTDVRDSTIHTEVHNERVTYLSREIPLTSLVREEIEYWFMRRTWQIGRSNEAAPMRMLDKSSGQARLVDFGSGLAAAVLTPDMQKSIPARRAAAAPPAHKPVPAKPPASRKAG